MPLKIFIAVPSFFTSESRMYHRFFIYPFAFPSLFFLAQRTARIGSSNAISSVNHFDPGEIPRVRGRKMKAGSTVPPHPFLSFSLHRGTLNNSIGARIRLPVRPDNHLDKSIKRLFIEPSIVSRSPHEFRILRRESENPIPWVLNDHYVWLYGELTAQSPECCVASYGDK